MSQHQRAAVPATRSSAAVLKTRRRIVLVVLFCVLLSGVLASFLALSAKREVANFEVPREPNAAIAVGEQAVRDFLGSRTSSVPAADGVNVDWSVSPDGATQSAFPVSSLAYAGRVSYVVGDRNPTVVNLLRYRVAIQQTQTSSQSYYVDVPITDTPSGPVLADQPALLPVPPVGEGDAAAIDYTDLYSRGEGSVPAEVLAAVENWAELYPREGNNSEALRNLTGDQDGSHSYSGLGGWSSGGDPQVISALPVGQTEDATTPEGWIVQVRLVLVPPANNGPTLRTAYDLYVATDGSLASPPVIAWGPAGSAQDLDQFINLD